MKIPIAEAMRLSNIPLEDEIRWLNPGLKAFHAQAWMAYTIHCIRKFPLAVETLEGSLAFIEALLNQGQDQDVLDLVNNLGPDVKERLSEALSKINFVEVEN